jgi:hypothetical protein
MATLDVTALQLALDSQSLNNRIRLLKQYVLAASTATAHYYVVGGVSAPGKAGWVTSLVADSTADQATAIRTATIGLYP